MADGIQHTRVPSAASFNGSANSRSSGVRLRHLMKGSASTFAALLLVSCGVPFRPGSPLTGAWGGEHVSAVLTETGGTLTFDCAVAAIDGGIIPESSGRFEAAGTYTPEHGGPIREGEVLPKLPARFTGQVGKEQFTLSVTLSGTGETIGTFTLRSGSDGRVLRCL
jgi:hypothetical protein